jgi:hypothetical protein
VAQNQGMLVRSDCNALFYAEELGPAAAILKEKLPHLMIESVQSVKEMLRTSDDTQYYVFDKSFDEARDEPCLILHSSGSTGSGYPSVITEEAFLTLIR